MLQVARVEADSARLLATNYLEPFVNRLEDPFQVALVSYALLVAGSNVRNEAFTRLDEIKRVGEWREQVWVMAHFHCRTQIYIRTRTQIPSCTMQILCERDPNLNLSWWKHVLHNTM